MKGTMKERSPGRWFLRVYLGTDGDGKQKFLTETVKGGKREAQRRLAQMVAQVDDGRAPGADKRLTLALFLERWQSRRSLKVSAHTISAQAKVISKHINPAIGHLKLVKVGVPDIEGLYSGMIANGLSAATVATVKAVLSSAFKYGVKTGELTRNPVRDAEAPRRVRKEISILTDAQLRAVLTQVADHWLNVPVRLLLATGLRRGELLGLHWSDIEGNVIHLRHNLQDIDGERILGPLKTAASKRDITLPDTTVALLKAWRRHQREEQVRLGIRPKYDLVFYDRHGNPRSVKSFSHMVSKHGKLAGVLGLSPHVFRHQHASQLIAAGVNIKAIQKRLGHATVNTTLDVYGHLLPGEDPALAAVGEWLDQLG